MLSQNVVFNNFDTNVKFFEQRGKNQTVYEPTALPEYIF